MRIDNPQYSPISCNNFAGIIKNIIAGARCVPSSLISCDPGHGGVGGHGQDGGVLLELLSPSLASSLDARAKGKDGSALFSRKCLISRANLMCKGDGEEGRKGKRGV